MSSYFKGKVISQVLKDDIKEKYDKLLELAYFIESIFQNEKKRIEKIVANEVNKTDNEPKKQFIAEFYGENFDIIKEYSKIQRYALFTTAMNQFEYNIAALCKFSFRYFDLNKDFDNYIKKNGKTFISKAIEYLEEIVKIDTSNIKKCQIDNLKAIRNCIVHADGKLSYLKKNKARAIRLFISETTNIELNHLEKIILKNDFTENAINIMHTFNEILLNLVLKKVNS